MIQETLEHQSIEPGTRTLHADRAASMTSKPVAWLLAELGVTKTHSRPHVSTDTPHSESQFKTMKYRPEFPARYCGLTELDTSNRPRHTAGKEVSDGSTSEKGVYARI